MTRALAGICLAVLVVLGLPVAATAASDSPVIFANSTSYAGQPRPYTITVFNRLDNSSLSASIGGRGMSCRPAGAVKGLGTWKCSTSSKLGIGSQTITARASGGGKTRTASKTINVSSSFGISSSSGSVTEGSRYTVSGRFDGSGFSVRASATANGSSVGSTTCSTSGTSFSCSLTAATGASPAGTRYTVTVTESGPGGSRSDSTSVTVIGRGNPGAPSFSTSPKQQQRAQPLVVKGRASGSGQTIQLVLDPPASGPNWSSPSATCTSGSSLTWSCVLSRVLSPGKHTIAARALDPNDPSRVSSTSLLRLTVKAKPAVVTPTPTPTPTPSATPTPTVPDVEEPPVDQTPAPKKIDGGLNDLLELLVLALAILALARPGTLALTRGSGSASFTERNGEGPEVDETVGWGDQSPTWAAFGTDATDFWSRTAPPVIARRSPFLGRLAVDGVAIRAMFGSLWWLLPIGGLALGIAAAADTDYQAVPPGVGLLLGIVVLSCFDAFAGFVASLAFGICVAGDLGGRGLATVLVLGVLWTSLPLIAELLRPARRIGRGGAYYWDRLADLAIAAFVCGWFAHRVADALDTIAGTGTGIPAEADRIGLVAGAAVAVRVIVGHLVDKGWPERLRATEVFEDLPEPTRYAVVLGFLLRVGAFAVIGGALLGSCWQLWVGVLLFALPDLVAVLRTRLGLALTLRPGLPAGLTEILVLVVWSSILVGLVVSGGDSDRENLRMAFVAAAVLPGALGVAQVFVARDQERPRTSWALQLVGLVILGATAALAIHGWNY